MAVKIKFTKLGRLKKPFYRIVAMEERSKRDGKALDYIGMYDPKSHPITLKIDKLLLKKWLDNGALPTESVKKILKI